METNKEEIEKIEFYAEENQDIIGKYSPGLIHWYNLILLLVTLGGVWSSIYMKCPDVIQSTIQVSCSTPPVSLYAPNSGIITRVMVNDGQKVNTGDSLILFEDMLGTEHVQYSPISGLVDYIDLLGSIQQVKAGMILMTVNPECQKKFEGRAMFPASMVSRINLNSECVISLDQFNEVDYGNVHGRISKISKTPLLEDKYVVSIVFPDGLKTDIGKELKDVCILTGTLSIVVEDRNFLDLAWKPFRNFLSIQQ